MASRSKETVRAMFRMKLGGITNREIMETLNISESSLDAWWNGEYHKKIFLEFFPKGKKRKYKNKKKKPEDVEKEFYQLCKKKKLDYTFISTDRISNSKTKNGKVWSVKFKCENHHISDIPITIFRRKNSACGKCRGRLLSIDERIEILSKAHDYKYDYDLFRKEGYRSSKDSIPIICPDHGLFLQSYTAHKRGKGCQLCAGNYQKTGRELKDLVKYNSNNFLKLTNVEDDVVYKGTDSVQLECTVHHWHPVELRSVSQITSKSIACKTCHASKYELEAYHTLQSFGCIFQTERILKYEDGTNGFVDICVFDETGNELFFIEIDGEQHFIEQNWETGAENIRTAYQKQKKQDKKKNDYFSRIGNKLYRIGYNQNIRKEIESIISRELPKHKYSVLNVNVEDIKDSEAEALEIHRARQLGVSQSDIAVNFSRHRSYVSKILHGDRFKSLFLSLYPTGNNPHVKKQPQVKLTKEQKRFILSCFAKNIRYSKIKTMIYERFEKSVSRAFISRLAKENGFISDYWINLSEEQKERLYKSRENGSTYPELINLCDKEFNVAVSKPTLRKILNNFKPDP